MKVLNDFHCSFCNNTEEHLADNGTITVVCPTCNGTAVKQRRPIRAKLDHTFPGEEDRWVKRRAEKLKDEQSKSWYNPH